MPTRVLGGPQAILDSVPEGAGIDELRAAARRCRACPIGLNGTHAVFGEGPLDAPLVIVGEQPGDVEEKRGHPFVGPSGILLASSLAKAGLERDHIYVTNAVKHFKFEQQGKRRLHRKPDRDEVEVCRTWLDLELDRLDPSLVVAMGTTAALALTGHRLAIGASRGKTLVTRSGIELIVTWHPSAALRARDRRQAIEAAIVEDLFLARRRLG